MSQRRIPSIASEFEGADLGDERRVRRLVSVAEGIGRSPTASFPRAAGGDAALEGTYRLLGNTAITAEAILLPHVKMTCSRARELPEVTVIHDTTMFDYGRAPARTGMGILRGKARGFLAHVSLVIAPGEARLPLGIAAVHQWVRLKKKPKVRPELRARDPDRESKRWFEQVELVEKRLAGITKAIHLMDREGDAYPLFSRLVSGSSRFVVRCSHERILDDEDDRKLFEVLASQPIRCARTVQLSARRPRGLPVADRIHGPRDSRIARLGFSAMSVTIRRPRSAPAGLPANVKLNVVHVLEREAPAGEQPVEWRLVTTEPIDSERDILRVVDLYRSRWTIEELFKAVKTGCAFAERQLESFEALSKALNLLLPIAWRLLLLRSLARVAPDTSADVAVTPTQLKVLKAVSKKALPAPMTAADALAAIAAIGGHIPNNGPPGWQVLGRGYHDLLLLEVGWSAREAEM